MGYQQLLLIVLTIMVVGFAIVIGIHLFEASAVESDRDQVYSDLIHLSSDAQGYYKRQAEYGGGAGSYIGWDIHEYFKKYEDGNVRVSVKTYQDRAELVGLGTETGRNGETRVRVEALVKPTGTTITVTN